MPSRLARLARDRHRVAAREPASASRRSRATATVEAMLVSQIADLEGAPREDRGRPARRFQPDRHRHLGGDLEGHPRRVAPQEQVVGDRVRVRIEKAQPFFQGNNALLLFEATATGLKTGAYARLELRAAASSTSARGRGPPAGGRRSSSTSACSTPPWPDVGNGVLESLIQQHLGALGEADTRPRDPRPPEHSIAIGGLDAGVVQARRARCRWRCRCPRWSPSTSGSGSSSR